MNDLLIPLVTQLATIVAAVWSATEILGRATGWRKDVLAFIFGPLFASAGYALGFVTAVPFNDGWRGYLGAAFGGLIATLTARWVHDTFINPMLKRGASPGPPADGGT